MLEEEDVGDARTRGHADTQNGDFPDSSARPRVGASARLQEKLTRKELQKRKKKNARRRERYRLNRLLEREEDLWEQGLLHIAGVDEAGRGPLAGPVIAAAVIMPRGVAIDGVKDSKLLNAEQRHALANAIRREAICIGVGGASSREIDRINILRASHLAMRRAIARLSVRPDHVLVDGLPVRELGCQHTAIVDGDALVHSIACASIIAKTVRDLLMARLASHYPGYGWEQNAGYATAAHRGAIDELGMTPHHRRSFRDLQLGLEL